MADELKQELTLDASQVVTTLQQLDAEMAKYTNVIDTNIIKIRQFNTAQAAQTAALNKTAAGGSGAAGGIKKVGDSAGGATPRVGAFTARLESLIQVFTFQQALRGFGALFGAFQNSISGAIAFERQLAQITTISNQSDRSLDVLNTRITNLANEFLKPSPEVAAGFYQTLSNQVGDTNQSIQFFNEALKFSKSAVTDVSSAVDALSGIQNAYSQTSASAARNADILFRTIDLGRVNAKELGDSLGRITPLAAQLGVSLEEVTAAIATATVQGVKFQDAQTQILNLLVEAIKPTGDFKKRMEELGFASAEAGIASEGFIGFFTKIAAETKTSAELAKLFNNIRGLRGEISLFGDGGKRMIEVLDDITNSAGANQRAFEQIQFTNAEKVQGELERIKNTLIQGFGRDAVAALNLLNNSVGGATDKVILLGEVTAVAIGGAVIFSTGNQFLKLIQGIGGAFGASAAAATRFGIAGVAAFAATTVAVKLFQSEDFGQRTIDNFERIRQETGKFATDSANQIRDGQASERKSLDETVSRIQQTQQTRQAAFNRAIELAGAAERGQTNNLQSELNNRQSLIGQFFNSLKRLQDDAAQNQRRQAQATLDFELNINNRRFERSLQGLNAETQATKLIERSEKLRQSASEAFNKGNVQFSEQLLNQAAEAAGRAADLSGQQRRGEQQEQRILESRRVLQNQILLTQQQQVDAVKELEKANRPIADEATLQLELANELLKQREKATKDGDSKSVEGLNQRLTETLRTVDELGRKLSLGNLRVGDKILQGTEVQNAVDALRRAAGETPLELQFQEGVQRFRANAEAFFKADPLVINVEFQTEGFKDIQQRALELQKIATTGLERQTALPGAEQAVKVQVDRFQAAFDALRANLNQAFQKANVTASFQGQPGGLAKAQADFDIIQQKLISTEQKLSQIITDPTNFTQAGNLTKQAAAQVEQLLTPFRNLEAELRNTGTTLGSVLGGFGENVQKSSALVRDSFQGILESRRTLQQLQQEAAGGTGAQRQLQQLDPRRQELEQAVQRAIELQRQEAAASIETSAIIINGTAAEIAALQQLQQQEAGVGQAGLQAGATAAAGLSGIGASAQAQVPGVLSLASALLQLAQAQASSGGASFAARGGPVHFRALGGPAPRGTDTIPAMLSPGETVINSNSSRKFFSQLMAMNAGIQPSFRTNGESVGNTFGDINVNVTSAGNANVDARTLAFAIRREIRKGTSRL